MRNFFEMLKLVEQNPPAQNQTAPATPAQNQAPATKNPVVNQSQVPMNPPVQNNNNLNNTNPTKQAQNVDSEEVQKLKQLLGSNYSTFVKALDENVNEPKFKKAIEWMVKNGSKVEPKELSVPCVNLRPTQNEVVLDKSLSFTLKDPRTTKICLFSSGPVKLGPQGQERPIITSNNGKYVIDGHHRWSQLYCANPNASLAAMDIGNAFQSPEEALKAVQLSIAAVVGDVPFAKGGGTNLFKIDENILKDYVYKNIKIPEVVEIFEKFLSNDQNYAQETRNQLASGQQTVAANQADQNGNSQQDVGAFAKQEWQDWLNLLNLITEADAERQTTFFDPNQSLGDPRTSPIADYLWKNVQSLQQNNTPVPGAPKREVMPQTDDAPGWDKNLAKVANVASKIINPPINPAIAQTPQTQNQPQTQTSSNSHDGPVLNEWLVLSGVKKTLTE